MPKLWHFDYYMESMIQELVAKESVKLDFFFRVKDLVIGRRGYGSLKLLGKQFWNCYYYMEPKKQELVVKESVDLYNIPLPSKYVEKFTL